MPRLTAKTRSVREMLLDVREYTEPLSRTPAILRATVEGRPDAWLDSRHAEDVFSPREAVRHLAFCERESYITRARYILEPGAAFPSTEAADRAFLKSLSVEEMVDDFEMHRMRSLTELAGLNLSESDLGKEWRDEELGTQTVGNLLATWVAHDLYHLGQIFKSYSALYVDEIGPYQMFLNLPHFN
jgi:hypothetical protein